VPTPEQLDDVALYVESVHMTFAIPVKDEVNVGSATRPVGGVAPVAEVSLT
jgi:hypothetical protein